jgi:glycerophosphoryl diester phosphodiesterase
LSTFARQLGTAIAVLAVCAPAAEALDIYAHRGGTLHRGAPVRLENSLSAFKRARAAGADVVELDVHVSKDGVPFVIHDGTLGRTTNCGGPVADHTAAQIAKCVINVFGTGNVFKRAPRSKEHVPRLAAVLRWAKRSGVRLDVEINHYPNEPSYDPRSRIVNAELDAIGASGIPKRQILLQSFLPGNLDPARRRGYTTALITFEGANARALSLARSGGYRVLEPQWPVANAAGFVRRAHAAGRKVIPYTINSRSAVVAARAAGVDGIITDDPPFAAAAICDDARRVFRAAGRRVAAARAALRRAHGTAAKKRAAARLRAAQRKLTRARRARTQACA